MKKILDVITALFIATILILIRYSSNVIISIFTPWANTTRINPNQQLRTDEIIRIALFFAIYFLIKLF